MRALSSLLIRSRGWVGRCPEASWRSGAGWWERPFKSLAKSLRIAPSIRSPTITITRTKVAHFANKDVRGAGASKAPGTRHNSKIKDVIALLSRVEGAQEIKIIYVTSGSSRTKTANTTLTE